jgi:hypothetical protein
MGDWPIAVLLPTQDDTEQHKKHCPTSKPRTGFESALVVLESPVIERVLDRVVCNFIL